VGHLLMSIRPQFSTRIFSGEKRFELRRGHVRVTAGDVVWVYESAPTKAVVGAFSVGRVLFDDLDALWSTHGQSMGVTRAEYRSYFHGREMGCAIEVDQRVSFAPIALGVLRASLHGFRPPQSYMWCTPAMAEVLPRRIESRLAS
jgi:predicted transcriptional regulator